ncbi:dTMP kinase [Litoreibacter halocynthiae]|uniref:dTMP kinase n=1 Tax=Litoreibacter halocynthiae TaxID=1242689 RepID=UPI0024939C1E|nr:dTMP kinase [Litoreibacter halocynthiae]
MNGIFLTFEGIDGSGKSTQSRLLAGHLEAAGFEVVLTREPGGSPGAEDIRRLLVEGEPGRWSAETEILLFTAARRDHLERTILPALEAGKIVICDRFADSTRVYQGATRGDLRETVDALHTRMIGREPDLTLIIDMDPDIALERGLARGSGEDRFEEFGAEFQHKLRAGFLGLLEDFPDRTRLIDGTQGAQDVGREIASLVDTYIAARA